MRIYNIVKEIPVGGTLEFNNKKYKVNDAVWNYDDDGMSEHDSCDFWDKDKKKCKVVGSYITMRCSGYNKTNLMCVIYNEVILQNEKLIPN